MTEAKDDPVFEDASSAACSVTSEGRKTSENQKKYRYSEFGSRINTLHTMVKELTFRFFIFSECWVALLRTIVPREKRDIQGFVSRGAMHC